VKKLIEKYNDLLSAKYDEATRGEFKWLAPYITEKHIKPYVKAGIDVLDIGVGTGQTSKIFIDQKINVTGIDISEKMLAIAKSKFKFKKLVKYDIEQGLLNLFSQEKFDIIVAVGIFEFIDNIKNALNEMKQLLKEDVVLAFSYEVYEPNNKYGIKKVAPLGAGSENVLKLLNFKVYRRLPNKINNILKNLSLKMVSREKFTGYLRTQLKIPVPYELLVVKLIHPRGVQSLEFTKRSNAKRIPT